MKVISNSSPLINFAALERLNLLHTLYGTIAIPDAVYQEVVVAGRGYPDAAAVEQAGWIVRESVQTATAVAALRDLGPGEAEAIILLKCRSTLWFASVAFWPAAARLLWTVHLSGFDRRTP